MHKKITVFTPTFNRAFCLGNLYKSLKNQTVLDFIWLIIDDGSTDETREIVNLWKSENLISIQYLYKANQGMHSAHNVAYSNITTELSVCIDSDDYMPNDAVERIIKEWKKNKSDKYAGIIGFDAFNDGKITGSLPEGISVSNLFKLEKIYKIKGDKKIILRTAVAREFPPYPIFFDEKLVPLGSLYLMIDQKYQYICTNDVYCIIEYLSEGSSKTIFNQYKKSPNGFLYSRKLELKYSHNIIYSFTRAMHFISSSIFIRRWNVFKENPKKMITFFALPLGLIFHAYVLYKIKK
jgi:glycosyltransferase involved in cell wall biosynthesis